MAEIDIKELNDKILEDPLGAVMHSEDAYHSRIAVIADYCVNHPSVRIILLAGPSGSGKTTSANLIKDAIKDRGKDAIVVSLDDFYRDSTDPDYPRDEAGERDFECPEALHIEDIRDTLASIAAGNEFKLPKYDFKTGGRAYEKRHSAMPGGCVIVEGLHALNPMISEGLPHGSVLKIFVSVSTNINIMGDRILSGRKIRFIRRMVRDNLYRAADAGRTLSMWENVLAAEDVYLYPYKQTADIAFDTFHLFELAVMRRYAVDLISEDLALVSPYAYTVKQALLQIAGMDERLIPAESLIREFIPGGKYEDLY
jgi:uridine kinase